MHQINNKRRGYFESLKSFRTFILTENDDLMSFKKPENNIFWQYRSYTKIEDKIELKSVDVEIALNDFYLDWEKTA
jgi:hypothetical protein